MAQKIEGKDERPLQSFSFKDFLAVNTTNARLAIPDKAFYNLENAQPIGGGNIHSIPDISGVLHDYAADTVYYDSNVNINNTEYLIVATTNGKLFAHNVGAVTFTQINGAAVLSGASTRIVQWNNSNALIIDATGMFQWNGSGNIAAVTGTAIPSSGSAIAVYQNRVWVAQGRVLFFSAPGTFTDFSTANGGGSTTLIDPTLRSVVQALFAANGYLYIWGTSSINAISDLYVPSGASPPTPNFTNLNLGAIVGTDQPSSIVLYGRLVLFANRMGAWSLYGTTVQSISGMDPNNSYQSAIDGTWQYVDFTVAVSGGQANINSLLCAAFLIKRNSDPVFGTGVVLAMYQGNAAGGKWWTINTAATGQPTRISTAFVNGSPALFAYIGNKVYQLISNTNSAPAANVQTALWDFGDPITAKECIRGGIGISATGSASVTLNLDTPKSSFPFSVSVVGQVVWVNNVNAIVTWQNNALATVTWQPSQFQTYWGASPQAFSKYVGFTLKTAAGTIFELNSFLLDYKWAQRWVGN